MGQLAGVMSRVRRTLGPRARRLANRLDNPEVRAARRLLEALDRGPLDVVHFGASESLFVSTVDADNRSLVRMLSDELAPDLSIYSVVGAGYHPRLISEYVRLMGAAPAPRVVVVGIPVRVGYRPWAHHPLYGYSRAVDTLALIAPGTSTWRVRRSLPLPNAAEMTAFDTTPYSCLVGDSTIGDLRRQLKNPAGHGLSQADAARVLYGYHHTALDGLDESWLAGITALATELLALGSQVVLYHPPIPIGRGEALFGPEVRRINEENLAVVHERFRAGLPGVSILDTALSFADDCFIDLDDATEHVNESGRVLLTRLIATEVRRLVIAAGGPADLSGQMFPAST